MADPEKLVADLSEDECWALLVSNSLGRLAVSISGRPEIFPINYHADDGSILFRTAEGTKLFGLTINRDVALEIDDYDGANGWSVVAKGHARVLSTSKELEEVASVDLVPWIPTLKHNFVRIDVNAVSGRRVTFGPEPTDTHIDYS